MVVMGTTYSEYQPFFIAVASQPQNFFITPSSFEMPSPGHDTGVTFIIMANPGSGFTGMTKFYVDLTIIDQSILKGDLDIDTNGEISSAWSNSETWNSPENDVTHFLFNFKDYANSWSEFTHSHSSLILNTDGSRWYDWDANQNWSNLTKSIVFSLKSITEASNSATNTLKDWRDTTSYSYGEVELSVRITVDFSSGDVSLNVSGHMYVSHNGPSTQHLGGQVVIKNWVVNTL